MIYCYLMGGMGNQMFQYACARALSIEYNQKLVLDLSWYDEFGLQEYKLCEFSLPKDIEFGRIPGRFNRNKNKLLKSLSIINQDLCFDIYSKKQSFVYMGSEYKDLIIKNPDCDIYLQGYWQWEEYFFKHKELIISELIPKVNLANISLASEMNINPNSVCLHWRLGDYKKDALLDVCSKAYYFDAINSMDTLIENPTYYVFSNEIDEVRTVLGNKKNLKYIDDDYSDIEEFWLMTKCNNYIISNSTFSWWACYLSQSDNKKIICPDRWYSDNRPCGLICKDWCRIKI